MSPVQAKPFPVSVNPVKIECPNLPAEWANSAPDIPRHDCKTVGDDVIILATGPGVFKPDGKAKDITVTLKATPNGGWKWLDGTTTARMVTFTHQADTAAPQVSMDLKKAEVKATVDVFIVPALLEEIHFNNRFGNILRDRVPVHGDEDKSDDDESGPIYTAPQWQDSDFDSFVATGDVKDNEEGRRNGHNFPIAFVKGSKARFNAVCRLGNPLPLGQKLQLSSTSLDASFTVAGTEMHPRSAAPLTMETREMDVDANSNFENVITFFSEVEDNLGYEITWKLGIGGEPPIYLQRSVHTLYLTGKAPVNGMEFGPRESLFYYACKANAGETSTDAKVLLDAIHREIFATKSMKSVIPGLAKFDAGSEVLKFSAQGKNGYLPDSKGGVCGAWSEFMRDTAWIHGARDVQAVPVTVNPAVDVPGPRGNYKITKWYVPPRTVNQGEIPPQLENPNPDGGQGNGHTSAEWRDHYIVGFLDGNSATGPFYDPSYGTPKSNPCAPPDAFTSLEDYARLATAGFMGQRLNEEGQFQVFYWKEEHLQNIEEIVIRTTTPPVFVPQPPQQ